MTTVRGPVLICGATGMLGYDLKRTFEKHLGPSAVTGVGSADLDITDSHAVHKMFQKLRPTWVLNAAAYTNVDQAETEREKAHALNVNGPANLVSACREFGSRLIHYSTDQVFDGRSDRRWREDDKPNPLNHYSTTKYQGEREVLKDPNALILRVQWLYGDKKDRFTPLRNVKEFTPFDDQFGAPSSTAHIAEVTYQLLSKPASGILHFAYDDYDSWYGIYCFVREVLGLDTKLTPKKMDEVKLAAARPKFSVMSNEKLRAALGISSMGSWKEHLRKFLLTK